jgi:IclR family acetate operon transcriptional repressor
MSTIIERSFRILEELSGHPGGRTLSELATEMDVPLSAMHRLLNDLVAAGYVRRDERHGEFTLTMQVVSLGLRFLSASGIVDVAQPALERLAAHCGELVRLASVDADRLLFVAKAQGATQGLRYDPEMGRPVMLACSAAGLMWLATKTDEEALRLIAKQGFGDADDFGPAAPRTVKALMQQVHATRKRGFSVTVDVFQPAMNSMAAPIVGQGGEVIAILIVAGPMARLTEKRMHSFAPAMLATARELSKSSTVSPMLNRQRGAAPRAAL